MIKFEKARKSSIGLAAVVNFNAGVRVPGTEKLLLEWKIYKLNMKSMCRNLRILQEIKFHLRKEKDTETLKPPNMCGVQSFMMCKKCVYGRIGHTNISISDQQQSGTRNELGDNRSLRPELFRKIKFRLNGMPLVKIF